ncbi:MAG: hypothetical protein Q4D38_13055 [Planctomycetia bacterium]|nr:hypothetical protein [Planctomycetia bacterium]
MREDADSDLREQQDTEAFSLWAALKVTCLCQALGVSFFSLVLDGGKLLRLFYLGILAQWVFLFLWATRKILFRMMRREEIPTAFDRWLAKYGTFFFFLLAYAIFMFATSNR